MNEHHRESEIQRLADELEADRHFAAPPEACSVDEFTELHGYRPESHYYD
ncbi:MAG: hypothetical protein PVH31_02960 [Ectothiorhodospiraceae bacterium]|jgi:hypothetical protein